MYRGAPCRAWLAADFIGSRAGFSRTKRRAETESRGRAPRAAKPLAQVLEDCAAQHRLATETGAAMGRGT